jgi:hypothetical protein
MGIAEGENMRAVFVEAHELTDPNGERPLPLHEPREGHRHEVVAFRSHLP